VELTADNHGRASFDALRRLDHFREVVAELVPDVSPTVLATWTLNEADAFMSWLVLDRLAQDVDVLDIGTFVGASAFHYAGHPRVMSVVSVDPNPTLAEEINDKTAVIGMSVAASVDQRVLDVAREALRRSPPTAPIQLYEGVVGAPAALIHGGLLSTDDRVPIAEDGRPLVVHLDGLHTPDAVRDDLVAVFSVERTIGAFVDDCRYGWGPFIQAGVAAFLRENPSHTFELLADMAPTASALGVVFRRSSGFGRAVGELASDFTKQWDVLRLLQRESDLIGEVAELRHELTQAQSALRSLRYRVADHVAHKLLAVPGVASLKSRIMPRA
jgi:hypothetical protein